MRITVSENFGDYLVFMDESGDHNLTALNHDFRLFALVFCMSQKAALRSHIPQPI